ncbi:MAG: putative Ig domain-containing protein, partial [Planctomycetota bacterium]
GDDFTGTRITSTSPVAVLGGSSCANVPGNYAACDTLVEQMPPLNTWGSQFVLNPLAIRDVDLVRLTASLDDTVIQVGTDTIRLDTGQSIDFDLTDPAVVQSNQPIQVAQFSVGDNYQGSRGDIQDTIGDPAMLLVPPVEQWLDEYVVTTRVERNDANYIGLTVPNLVTSEVFLGEDPLPSSIFSPVPGTDFSVANISVLDNTHVLTAPMPFGVTVYGFSGFESYAYLGGQSFTPLDVNPAIELTPETESRLVGQTHTVTASVTDEFDQPVRGVLVTFDVSGTQQFVASSRTDSSGIATLSWDGQLAATDTVVATSLGVSDSASVDWFGAFPAIEVTDPENGFDVEAGSTVLISGQVDAGSPEARVIAVLIDGVQIETVDSAGNFFVTVDQPLGETTYGFEVINSYGVSAYTTHDLVGTYPGGSNINLESLVNVSAITESYAVTSFDARSNHLYAELSVTNSGTQAITLPFLVGVQNISDNSVDLLDVDGYWTDGTPYIDLSDWVESNELLPGQSTDLGILSFHVPERNPFEYDLVLLGGENAPPRFTSVPIVNARGGTGESYAATLSGVDPDGHQIRFEIVSGPDGLGLTNHGDGTASLSWTNIPAAQANYPVSLRVLDEFDAFEVQTYVLQTIDGTLNRPPVFYSVPLLDAYAEADYDYTALARDVDGDSLAYGLTVYRIDDVSQMNIAGIDGSGLPIEFDPSVARMTWEPTGADAGLHRVIFTADDGRGGVDTQVFDLNVNPVVGNYPPRFTSTPVTNVLAGDPYEYQATAVDPDLDPVSFRLVTGPPGANMTTEGLFTYAIPDNQTANYEFTVEVLDGRGHIVPQSFTIAAVDGSPATLSGRVYHDVNADATYDGSDTAVANVLVYLDDNANLRHDLGEESVLSGADGTYSLPSPPGAYRVAFDRGPDWATLAPQELFYAGTTTPAENVGGLDIRLTNRPPENNAPEIISTPSSTARYLELYTYDVDAVDVDGDSLTYSLIASPPGATIDEVTGFVSWIPGLPPRPGERSSDFLSVRVTDPFGGSDIQSWQPEVVFDNHAPEFVSEPSPVATVDLLYTYQAVAFDQDGDVLTYYLDPASRRLGLDIEPDTGLLTWTPEATGAVDVHLTVTDPRGGIGHQTFTLYARTDAFPVFDMPERIRREVGVNEPLQIFVSDPLGDLVTVWLDDEATLAGASIEQIDVSGDQLDDDALVFIPQTVDETPLKLIASDPQGNTAEWTVIVESYIPGTANTAPTIVDVPAPILRRDLPMRVTALAEDVDGDDLTWSFDANSLPDENDFFVDPMTGVITWTPSQAGQHTVTVTVNDGNGGIDSETVTYVVLANAPPRFTSDPIRFGTMDLSYSYPSVAIDPNDGETEQLLYLGNVLPSVRDFGNDPSQWPDVDATIDENTGELLWEPSAIGRYFVTLFAVDPHGELGAQAFEVRIIGEADNAPPVILEDPPPRRLLSPPTGDYPAVSLDAMIQATDENNDPLTFSLLNGPSGMTITPEGRVRWTPSSEDVGRTGSYGVRVIDGRGGSDSATFTYHVDLNAINENQPPDITSQPRLKTQATRPYAYNVDAIDPEFDAISYSLQTGPAGMSIDPVTGILQFTPTLNQLGDHTVTVVATDSVGASDSQSFQLFVMRGDAAPQITSSPLATSRTGDYYHYAVTAVDDDRDPLTFSLVSGSSEDLPLSIDPETGVLSGFTPTVGSYEVVVRVDDPTARFDTQTFTIDVTQNGYSGENNRPPTITTVPETVARIGSEYVFDFDADDPDIPLGDFLNWTKSVEIPGTQNAVTFDTTAQQLRWTPDPSEVNTEIAFQIRVTDSIGSYSSLRWTVFVREANVAPTIQPITDQTIAAGSRLAVDVLAEDQNDDPLTYTLDGDSIARGITIDDAGRIRWSTTLDDLDDATQTIVVSVDDGYAAAVSETFNVTLTPDVTAPEVDLTGNPPQLDAGQSVDLQVRANDNVGIVSRTLTLVSVTGFDDTVTTLDIDVPLSDSGTARFMTDVSHLGELRFRAQVADAAGLTATDEFVLDVFDPNDVQRPQVRILSPSTGDEPLTAVDIVGSVDDDIANGLSWTLTIQATDSSAPPIEVNEGTGKVNASILGMFDPTILRDGSYRITLTATDSGNNTATDTEIIDVKTDLKLGNFNISFTDLQIPVSGIPITLTRSYDTLDADVSGDFGYGWSLEFAMPKMYVNYASLGSPSFSGYGTFVNGTRINVLTPEGNTEGFTFFWRAGAEGINDAGVNGSTRYVPTFEGDSGNAYRLIPPAADGTFRRLTENGPHQDDSGKLYSGLDPYFGGVFRLEQADSRGRQLEYDILVGTKGQSEFTAHRVRDKYDNALEIYSDGIFSQRTPDRSVQIVRDNRGRITEIIDPRGNSLLYRYNADGQLAEFYDRRATQRLRDAFEGNEFEPTRFEYGPEIDGQPMTGFPGIENYMTKVIDPLGVTAVEQEYSPVDGRLSKLRDAEGNEQSMLYRIDTPTTGDANDPERHGVASASGTTTGLNPVQSSFDAYGRLIREETPSGQVTIYTYANDEIRYPYQIIQVIGEPDTPEEWADRSGDDRVTSRQYHSEFAGQGAVREEINPDGEVTTTYYNTWGFNRGYPSKVDLPDDKSTTYQWAPIGENGKVELVGTIDQDGNSTQYGYDQYGSVNFVGQGNVITGHNTATSFAYNEYGDLVATADQDGNIRTISYNENGEQTGTEFAYYPGDQRPPTGPSQGGGEYTAADYPSSRTIIRTSNDLDVEGDVLSSSTEVVEQVLNTETLEYEDVGDPVVRNESGVSQYDALGRASVTSDDNERQSFIVYDKRGLAVETWTESPDIDGNSAWSVSRTVYDTEGRAVYSTGSVPADTPVSEITGSYSIYDTAQAVDVDGDSIVEPDSGLKTGRMLGSQQLVGTDITVTPIAGSPTIDVVHEGVTYTVALLATSALTDAGTTISSSRSFYDENDRVTSTENDHGLRSQTLYDEDGRVIESRSEIAPATVDFQASGLTGQSFWSVSRTIYDEDGKVIASTDRFIVPADTPLGEDPASGPVPTQITITRYDDQDRTVATERYVGATIIPDGDSPITMNTAGFKVDNAGVLESVSETLYDAAGRVWRTISGRVPRSEASAVELAQSDALASYPIYGSDGSDAYADQNLIAGVISDTLFDDRGRQFGSLGHPLPIEDLGLTPTDFGLSGSGLLVRPRSETVFNSYGQTEISRGGLAQVQEADGTSLGIFDHETVDVVSHYDPFGNVVRMDYVTGGTLSVTDADSSPHQRSGGVIDSYMQTVFDDDNRPVAEMQQTAGTVDSLWDETLQSFVVDDSSGDTIPTKLYHYDDDDRLSGVSLPIVDAIDPQNPLRPKYEYGYDDRGNQTLIVDPLGQETRFTFTDRGQQASRTLPLGFGSDGMASTADLDNLESNASSFGFTERFTYDTDGRQKLHISFEGVITETLYDEYDRMWAMNYYADDADYVSGLVSERDEYAFDIQGGQTLWHRYSADTPASIADNQSAGDVAGFTLGRSEAVLRDERGRVAHEISEEGVVSYGYDSRGRMAFTAVNANLNSIIDANTGLPIPLGETAIGTIGYSAADPATSDRVTFYEYDALGRLAEVSEDNTPAVTTDSPATETDYSYDLQGRVADHSVVDASGDSVTTTYTYDTLGRLDTQTDTNGSGQTLAEYDYTVRADGKRTALSETFWIDADSDGNVDTGEQKPSTYTWTYDEIGRLTDEVLDHWDNNFDQTESFEYDLTGNRTERRLDSGSDSSIDEAITYQYDANDRLEFEWLDESDDGSVERTTQYSYDHTQQTDETVRDGFFDESTSSGSLPTMVSRQRMYYDLQGRLGTLINQGYDSFGTLTSRERVSYEYDRRSYRVVQTVSTGGLMPDVNNEVWTETNRVEFLADHHNHTGYTQTLRETDTASDGSTKTTDYTFGNDEIAQRVVERDSSGVITQDSTHVFGHDGHGSVRVLYDAAAAIAQVYTFAAYGQMLTVHDGTATSIATTDRLSSLGYSGEHFDAKAQQQYLRARFYNPANGRFNRLDPYIGDQTNPNLYNKYLYAAADPIQNVDPSGEVPFTVSGLLSSIGTGIVVGGVGGAATGAAYGLLKYRSFSAAFQHALLGAMYGAAVGAAVGGSVYSLGAAFATGGASFTGSLQAAS